MGLCAFLYTCLFTFTLALPLLHTPLETGHSFLHVQFTCSSHAITHARHLHRRRVCILVSSLSCETIPSLDGCLRIYSVTSFSAAVACLQPLCLASTCRLLRLPHRSCKHLPHCSDFPSQPSQSPPSFCFSLPSFLYFTQIRHYSVEEVPLYMPALPCHAAQHYLPVPCLQLPAYLCLQLYTMPDTTTH